MRVLCRLGIHDWEYGKIFPVIEDRGTNYERHRDYQESECKKCGRKAEVKVY